MRYIKSSIYGTDRDNRGEQKPYTVGYHPLDVIFPSMGDWFEEDVFNDLASILGVDEYDIRALVAKNAGFNGDPYDFDATIADIYDFFDNNKNYYYKLEKYIEENPPYYEEDF